MDGSVGDIRLYAGRTAPGNWQFCDGRNVVSQGHDKLRRILGNIYGGNADFIGTPSLNWIPTLNGAAVRYMICTDGAWPYSLSGVTGEIRPWPGPAATIPANWLPCDGRSLNRRNFTGLGIALGSKYGGDFSTFKIPSLAPPGAGLQYIICAAGSFLSADVRYPLSGLVVGEVRLMAGLVQDPIAGGMSNISQGQLTFSLSDYGLLNSVLTGRFGTSTATTFHAPSVVAAPGPMNYFLVTQGLAPI